MSDKFDQVTVDEDTTILVSLPATLGDYDVLYQNWSWEGITAESIIFVNEDVAELNDSDLEKEVRTSPLLEEGTQLTITRSESGFTFVNFNFKTR